MKGQISIPWPYEGLSPNDRSHWRAKARATKAYRFAASMLAREAGWLGAQICALEVTFCPPSGWRTGDMDNLISRFKAAQDGLADALGINDRAMRLTYAMGERCKGGAVVVRIPVAGSVEPMP